MIKKLTRHGNSSALVIDRPVLELIGADADTSFEIVTNGRSLILTPVAKSDPREVFKAAVEEAERRYGAVFRKLAE